MLASYDNTWYMNTHALGVFIYAGIGIMKDTFTNKPQVRTILATSLATLILNAVWVKQ